MDARILRVALLAALSSFACGANYRTANFVVSARDPQFAKQVGETAEKFRRELAVEWLGKELPKWAEPCPITVQEGATLGAGGATSFMFSHGEVYGWRMNIQGPANRILDSVLPHEVTHTIFASHFRQPLPRWADEGACTTVEHPQEKAKHRQMLVQFLRTGRGIAFSDMFRMKEYPRDILPLYAQGYSLASFLIDRGGRRKFVQYVEDGLRDNDWARATQQHYGFGGLGLLQDSWLAWIKQGMPAASPAEERPAVMLAAAPPPRRPRPAGDLVFHKERIRAGDLSDRRLVPVRQHRDEPYIAAQSPDDQSNADRLPGPAGHSRAVELPASVRPPAAPSIQPPTNVQPVPPPVEQPAAATRRVILRQWSRDREPGTAGSTRLPGPIHTSELSGGPGTIRG